MSWLALLLGDGLKLNPRVKVISWNYDFQVELALARYCKAGALDQMHDRFGIYPGVSENTIHADNFFMTHLNGIAGQERRGSAFFPWYRGFAGFYPGWLAGVFEAYGDTGVAGSNFRAGFVERLTFAWEGSEVAQQSVALAVSALKDADVLVVIGYSFPAFNRLIDQSLMEVFSDSGTEKRKLVIQNPSMQEGDVKNMFELDWKNITVVMDTNRDQYHLPNELFRSSSQ